MQRGMQRGYRWGMGWCLRLGFHEDTRTRGYKEDEKAERGFEKDV
jgi:hypothetical protein